jgi:Fe-S-cluster-containing dehydrogenase component
MKQNNGQFQWQTLEDYAAGPVASAARTDEFRPGQHELEVDGGVGRRHFLGLMGASMAMTGVLTSGCIRKPSETILPFAKRPEDLVPGESRSFASTLQVAGAVYGVLIESFDGRPIKIEGNPDHPTSLGATSHFAQAEVLNVYDQSRLRAPLVNGQAATIEEAQATLGKMVAGFEANAGRGLALVTEWVASPTYQKQLSQFQEKFPAAKIYLVDESRSQMEDRAMRLVGLPGGRVRYDFQSAQVVLSIDGDFLGLEGEAVRHTKEFSRNRRVTNAQDPLNRLYAVESHLTVTGAHADHRLLLSPSGVAELLVEVARDLDRRGAPFAAGLVDRLGSTRLGDKHQAWIRAVSEDLMANSRRSVVVVGDRQPEWVHALGLAINEALENIGRSVSVYPDGSRVRYGSIDQLAVEIKSGLVSGLIIAGGNPVHTAPGDVGFSELVGRVSQTVFLGRELNETAAACSVVLPQCHGIEAWGDFYTLDGTISLRQPLIAPLFPSWSEIEFLNHVLGKEDASGYVAVQETFSDYARSTSILNEWKQALHDGVTRLKAFLPLNFDPVYLQLAVLLRQQMASQEPTADRLELVFAADYSVYDGRYVNNAWLQEFPDPLTKITWDNALLIGPPTADALGLERGDIVEVTTESGTARAAVFVQPGVAPFSAVLNLGYGRSKVGVVGAGTGFDVAPLRSARSPYFAAGARIKKTGESYMLATTQGHQKMEGRPIVREATLEQFREEPRFVEKYEVMPLEKQKTLLWKEPNITTGQQWGMTIDLNACTGCGSCAIACQSENNIAIVGKTEVNNNREMAWIRIDRYFTGDDADPQVVVQPVNCMHCETAPCEGVCPVGATIHGPEGTNDMAYNRCIGTRYCANNCPYKVRRFNYFNFSKRQDEMDPLIAMQQNPNVTVRFRGVIEKCSYCIQRVNKARIAAKRDGNGVVPDGSIQTACQQACPAEAIEFGDIRDPLSRVAQSKANPRNYGMLGELNTRPRTTYLAKIRNPHSKLV